MEIKASADSKDVTFFDGNTVFRTQVLAPGVIFYAVNGYISYEFTRPAIEIATRELRRAQRLVMFVDGREIAGMNPRYREEWTDWIRANKKSQIRMLLLIKSALMTMASNTVNMAVGLRVLEMYSDPLKFELECAKVHPGFVCRRVSNLT